MELIDVANWIHETFDSDEEVEAWCIEQKRPLVRAKRELLGFPFAHVDAGDVGISLRHEEGRHVCAFDGGRFGPYVGILGPDDIEVLDEPYTSNKRILELQR